MSEGADPREPKASELIGEALGTAARRAGLDPSSSATTGHVVWKAMGGWRGVVESVLPSLIFVVAYTVSRDLVVSLIASVGIAAVFTVVRFAQKSPPAAALGGLIAAAIAAVLSLLTGNPSDNFVPGLLTNAAYGTAMLVSALIGWPLIGLAAGYLMGEGVAWRRDRRKRRAFFWLTIAWAALFAVRLGVQLPIYLSSLDPANRESAVALLGTLKIAMGLPLFAPLVAVTWLTARALYVRRAATPDADAADAPR
ncbi:DUF3159 domain-containing protein [Microbacterium sp. cx-55]|uniref:DUF3159 domain-containing protein n=1 Tax=Microbacterium sp. cx-55 TaxID=2875948 RepID=UPI001CC00DE7|nr:DUF3159 domain-containing protein [Microbacterium sp. cx-55]MBZ4486338.1 DUF3159 domain-containing protein [Microbacterium sp. cx-55]UGB33823.1 DUF3159 domain-containing protein [Microbacterium sp. cx-55]